MEPDGIRGQVWTENEIDLVVADYFDMLKRELRGERYVKVRYNDELAQKIGRSSKSIEFKHQNISAVLVELCEPRIKGYMPLTHYQGALVQGVERFLDRGNAVTEIDIVLPKHLSEQGQIFVEAPPICTNEQAEPNPDMARLLRKYDPAARDQRNRRLGKSGEECVLHSERARLVSADRSDLARKVRWVSQEDGDGAGFDILSFNPQGQERFLEVKTTVGHRLTPFFLSRNEKEFSDENVERFRIFRLFDFARTPRAFKIGPPLERHTNLQPEVYKASFR